MGPIANALAIQVHGGYLYTRDFDVEQIYQDNRLKPNHEGTTGIQALDLLGCKILRCDGRAPASGREDSFYEGKLIAGRFAAPHASYSVARAHGTRRKGRGSARHRSRPIFGSVQL